MQCVCMCIQTACVACRHSVCNVLSPVYLSSVCAWGWVGGGACVVVCVCTVKQCVCRVQSSSV